MEPTARFYRLSLKNLISSDLTQYFLDSSHFSILPVIPALPLKKPEQLNAQVMHQLAKEPSLSQLHEYI